MIWNTYPKLSYLYIFFLIYAYPHVTWAKKITFSTADEFFLDTPVTTPYERVTLDFHSFHSRTKNGSTTNTPALVANVGVYPDVQAYAVIPATLAAPNHGSRHYGYGDVKLGLKYRFVHETETLPSIALYPKITFPSGESDKGLGNGTCIGRFPLWMQKTWDKWRVTTGGGYFVNPAKGERNYPFGGVLIQLQITKYFMLGNEFVGVGKINAHNKAKLISNFGGSYFFNSHSFLAFSIGHSIAGAKNFVAFLGYGIAWGPLTDP
ncbi:MAG: transporter [Alphaproteobacteria bacterium]|nr:transporter [Alphaproteobacteria bacterium]